MKTLKSIVIIACGIAALAFTSCNSDSDTQKGLTAQEISYCYNTVKGRYTGDLIYAAKNENNPADVSDTIKSVRSDIINDSTMILYNFPARLLAPNVKNGQVRGALLEADWKDLTCRTVYIGTNPVEFLVNPLTLTFNVPYNGETEIHKIQVVFYTNNLSSWAQYNEKDAQLKFIIYEGAIYLDGRLLETLDTATAFYFESTSKVSADIAFGEK